jgi:hypothetical protein
MSCFLGKLFHGSFSIVFDSRQSPRVMLPRESELQLHLNLASARQLEESSKYEHQADNADAQTIPHWWPVCTVRAQVMNPRDRQNDCAYGKQKPWIGSSSMRCVRNWS